MNEELDSQLSAMFDNELPAVQCELLARRLSRDEDLKARWERYAVIGATIRAEGGARLNTGLAVRVNSAISSEPLSAKAVNVKPAGERTRALRWWAPVGGAAIAASVAAAAILWVRFQSPPLDLTAQNLPIASPAPAGGPVAVSTNTPDSYVVPKPHLRRAIFPATQLANYVVAHSEFSSPVVRRNLLSALMASEGTAGAPSGSEEPTEDANDDANSPQ
jgi:sigma-E factor negative regulatory protein RseA